MKRDKKASRKEELFFSTALKLCRPPGRVCFANYKVQGFVCRFKLRISRSAVFNLYKTEVFLKIT